MPEDSRPLSVAPSAKPASMRSSTDSHTRRTRSTTAWMNASAPSADPTAPGRSVPPSISPLSAQLAMSA